MIRLEDIQKALLNVVGWEQAYDPAHLIDKALCVSESGLTFQGAHPLCTLENIRAIMPDNFFFSYPEWNRVKLYRVGAKVRHEGKVWIAAEENINTEPKPADFNEDFNNDFNNGKSPWYVYNMESDFVRSLTIKGINQVIQNFLQTKQLNQETKNLWERRTFFDGAANLKAMIDPRNKIVGFEIVPVRAMGVTTKIERVGLQMIGGVGKVTMYLFHSSQVAPMRTLEFEYTNTRGGFQWFTPEEPVYLPYISNGHDAGGAWFLCYNQTDLPDGMRALNVSKDWSGEPCQTCLGGSLESWRELTKYLQVSPFSTPAPEGFAENPSMFDIGLVNYTNTMNYGLNLEVTVGCDLTDFIISQKDIFATVIQKQVASNVLRTVALNPDVRVNRNQVNTTREDLLYELDGTSQGRPSGLGYELRQAYKALTLDTQGLDRICLKCNNHGVKYRTV